MEQYFILYHRLSLKKSVEKFKQGRNMEAGVDAEVPEKG